MAYTLNKPFTDTQRADFICEHQGLNYYEDDNCIIMHLASKNVENGIVTDISDTDEYKKAIKAQENAAKLSEYTTQIEELEKKIQRSLIAKASGSASDDDNSYFCSYLTQINTLRQKINDLTI